MSTDQEDALHLGDLFVEPPRPPSPEPTITTYIRSNSAHAESLQDWKEVNIRLVGNHSLWGHYLWNAARVFAEYLDDNVDSLCRGMNVLELGAGGGLPGLVCALNGAKNVVLTDYPDRDLLRNLELNVENNIPAGIRDRICVKGHVWGTPVTGLRGAVGDEFFDVIIMSDLIFNHSQHDALLRTCEETLSRKPSQASQPSPCCLVFYTHHRPHLAERDLDFFRKAKDKGWNCEEIVTKTLQPMFASDPGDASVRSTVHGWKLTRTSTDEGSETAS